MLDFIWAIVFRIFPFAAKQHTLAMSQAPRPPPGSPDSYILNKEGLWLYTHKWLPKTPVKAVVFLLHGMGEHCLRYQEYANHLTQQGYAVFALDHQGHGKSEGDRQHVVDFNRFTDDVLAYVDHVNAERRDLAALPRFVIGHSMGGLIAILATSAAKKAGKPFTASVFIGPALKPDPATANPVNLFLARVLSTVAPKFAVWWEKGPVERYVLSHNDLYVADYKADPLVYKGGMRILFGWNIVHYMQQTLANAASFDAPYLLIHGTEDKACLIEGSEIWHSRTKSSDKSFIPINKGYHELLNESDEYKKPTWAHIDQFLAERISKKP